jgi:hypothetical protein
MHVILTTTPLFVVLVYFLYEAYRRPNAPIYNLGNYYTDDQWQIAADETGALVGLMDILVVFLSLHVLSTLFAVYVITFIPKRRHLIGRYLKEGKPSVGDVIYDKTSRACGGFNDYGYTLYAHPTKKKLIRKRVRVYQQYTRERITILRLPNRPLSGQAKVDLEIDLNAASKERDTKNKYIAILAVFWVLFTLLAPIYVLYQMGKIEDENDTLAKKVFLIIVGLNLPFAFACNWIRFLLYRNWMVNRGAVVDDDPNARRIDSCLHGAPSEDGSDAIPYSILNEEDMSYQGSLRSHTNSFQGSIATMPLPSQIVLNPSLV